MLESGYYSEEEPGIVDLARLGVGIVELLDEHVFERRDDLERELTPLHYFRVGSAFAFRIDYRGGGPQVLEEVVRGVEDVLVRELFAEFCLYRVKIDVSNRYILVVCDL